MKLYDPKVWILLLLVGFAVPCGAANHVVSVGGINNFSYSPSQLTIQQGDTVTFRNVSGVHNVVADNGSFRCANGCSGSGGNGNVSAAMWQATVTFNTPGTFGYYCEAHGSPGGGGMSGSITVQGTAPSLTIGPAFSGNWFDPNQDGHGFQLEVLPNGVVTAFWFTFDNAGNPAWIAGIGSIEGDHVTMQAARVLGGRFPPNFNPANITRPAWGSMTFTFTDCNHGNVTWTSTDAAFTATGTMALTRVTQIAGTVCE